jgi:hypothetical protein
MIIGISGFINSAKDRTADYLVKHYGFKKESFAGLLKDCVSVVFGWDRVMLEGTNQTSRNWRNQVDPWWAERLGIPYLTPRWVLQHWATEALRDHFHQDIWIAALENKLRKVDYNLVISDCRFPNEIEAIRNQGGKVIWIKRLTPEWYDIALESNLSKVNQMAVKYPHIHKSEWAVLGIEFDNTIQNNGDLDWLHGEIDRVAKEFGLPRMVL